MRRLKKLFTRPFKRWDAARIKEEKALLQEFGLKNKRELWRAKTKLKRFRSRARELFVDDSGKEALFNNLKKRGIFTGDTTIDDVLGMRIQDILERRLQTKVLRKKMAQTIGQARQLITHRHITVNGKIVDIPSFVVTLENENKIGFADGSPIKDIKHPIRQKVIEKDEKKGKKTQTKKEDVKIDAKKEEPAKVTDSKKEVEVKTDTKKEVKPETKKEEPAKVTEPKKEVEVKTDTKKEVKPETKKEVEVKTDVKKEAEVKTEKVEAKAEEKKK